MSRPVLIRAGTVCMPTLRYWMETEVHVYAFSIAANVLLSFFPFLIVMASLCRYVLHWPGAEEAIHIAVRDYFPGETADFLRRNLNVALAERGPIQWVSVLLLFFTANGVFEPLEVALNRAWGITQNRSFFMNQLVSLGLILGCGGLMLMSASFTALNGDLFGGVTGAWIAVIFFKIAAVPISILLLFLVYWLLPNGRIPPRHLIAVSIFIGLALEALKYVNLLTLPWLRPKLIHEYGPFVNSVAIILWSFLASMIVLAGAEWSARSLGKNVDKLRTDPLTTSERL